MMRPEASIELNISCSFSIASVSTRHLGSNSKPSTSSLATISRWHSAFRLSMVMPSPGTTSAQLGLSSSTSKDTWLRDTLVSKLDMPSSNSIGQLLAVRWIASMYGSSKKR